MPAPSQPKVDAAYESSSGKNKKLGVARPLYGAETRRTRTIQSTTLAHPVTPDTGTMKGIYVFEFELEGDGARTRGVWGYSQLQAEQALRRALARRGQTLGRLQCVARY